MKKRHSNCNSQLPVLTALLNDFPTKKIPEIKSIVFVCVQHLVFTTVNLIDALIQLGATPDNIHIMGKSYSSCSEVADQLVERGYHYYPNSHQDKIGSFAEYFVQDVKRMWRIVYEELQKKEIKLIVVLDDGGSCLSNVPDYISKTYSLVGVEQTRSGLAHLRTHKLSFPVIDVASSAAKQLVESPMIAEAVVKKVSKVLPLNKATFSTGVAGLGVIGNVTAQKLLSLNHHVITYDKESEQTQLFPQYLHTKNVKELIHESEYIFGCTGEDITTRLEAKDINADKVFISCSSQDKEFLTLLKMFEAQKCQYDHVLDHLECSLNGHLVKIYRGGFPINLDNSGESVEAQDIQLTRGLLLGGILQGILYALLYPKQSKLYMLHPTI
ncbi:MAG: hypothetical protein KBD90_00950 [Alphaproteobacteria bacterium]|nr:hypothetical protein [Alphaproteobacteria bacterium]